MTKIPQNRNKGQDFRLGMSKDDPITKAAATPPAIKYEPYCESNYGCISDEIKAKIYYPETDHHGFCYDQLEDGRIINAIFWKEYKRKKHSFRTTKEIADDLMKKAARKAKRNNKSSLFTRKLIRNNKIRAAKAAALKARRREFASQRARLILILIENGNDYVCSECGTEENLTVDHIYPLSKGGTDDPSNLTFLCQSCNSKKGTKILI